jgi:osmotically-inducible protein OsmY
MMEKTSPAKIKRLLTPTVGALSIALLVSGAIRAAERTDADNTRVNERDANSQTLTPLDQSNTSSDTALAAKIRSSITDDKSLSVNAQNVKVIVREGAVTLRGPVEDAAEKARVEAIAKGAAGTTAVHSEIDIKH